MLKKERSITHKGGDFTSDEVEGIPERQCKKLMDIGKSLFDKMLNQWDKGNYTEFWSGIDDLYRLGETWASYCFRESEEKERKKD